MKGFLNLCLSTMVLLACSGSQKNGIHITPEKAHKNLAKYEKAVIEKPGNVNALFKLAQAHTATGDYEKAFAYLDKVTELDVNFANAYLLRASIFQKTGDKKENIRALSSLLGLPHGHNYTEIVAKQVGMPYPIKPLNVGNGNNLVGRYSPDGKHIAWQSDRDGDWNIYMANADGSSARAITFAKGNDQNPVFSQDNRLIAYTSTRDEFELKDVGDVSREIYIFVISSRQEKRLTKNDVDDWAPIFYPDSSALVFVSEEHNEEASKFTERASRLMALNATGDKTKTLFAGHGDNTSPAAAPDGRLAWVQINDGVYTIVISEADGEPLTLYNSRDPIGGLCYSPDGATLAFFMKVEGNIDIYRMDLQSKEVQRLTASLNNDYYPMYSPAGDKILFSSDRHGKNGLFFIDLTETVSRDELRSRLQTQLDDLEKKQESE